VDRINVRLAWIGIRAKRARRGEAQQDDHADFRTENL